MINESVEENEKPRLCVNCGNRVKKLYKKYNADVLKLKHCDGCNKLADKYIEYDIVIILIDLILFKKEPYRHIIYNTEFRSHWKLWLITFLLKTYVAWAEYSETEENITMERAFYTAALKTAAVDFSLSFVLGAFCILSWNMPWRKNCLIDFWKALVLSDFGSFLMLPSLIWTDVPRSLHRFIVTLYVLISRVQALSVVTSCYRATLLPLLLWPQLSKIIISTN